MATTTKAAKTSQATATAPRLRTQYQTEIAKDLQKELNLGNIHQVPRLEKIVVNVGLGKAKDDKKVMEVATNTLRKITGQQPIQTTAKNSIAGFKLREGNKIGLKVTLRGDRMYEFTDRLITLVLHVCVTFTALARRLSISKAITASALPINQFFLN